MNTEVCFAVIDYHLVILSKKALFETNIHILLPEFVTQER